MSNHSYQHRTNRCAARGAMLLAGVLWLIMAGFALWTMPDRLPLGLLLSACAATMGGAFAFLVLRHMLKPMNDALQALAPVLENAADGELHMALPNSVQRELPDVSRSLLLMMNRVQSSIDSIQHVALHDSVTGLPNRLNFRRLVERRLRQGRATGGSRNLLLFLDLDGFKAVNDSLGHAQGDSLLAIFAKRIQVLAEAVRSRVALPGDDEPAVVARLAGDEFVILIPNAGAEDAERIAKHVLKALEDPFELPGASVIVSASIGICTMPEDGHDYETLMRKADTAMYAAKEMGRNQFQFYSEALNARARDRLQTDSQLRQALAQDEFELFYQPQLDSRTGRVVAVEALIRWRHPAQGLRGPASFIPIAEESGLIVDIGRWVLAEATRTLAKWAGQGMTCRISINVSPRQLMRPGFVQLVRACLEDTGAPPHLLEIEITESLMMSNDPETIDRITRLRQLGVSVAIDDFGTGYSNLARLNGLPIDRLKIDRSLVQDVATSDEARTIVTAIITLAHGLGFECVAEGIETPLQSEILSVMGCELLQGYAIARPLPSSALLVWMDAHPAGLSPLTLTSH